MAGVKYFRWVIITVLFIASMNIQRFHMENWMGSYSLQFISSEDMVKALAV